MGIGCRVEHKFWGKGIIINIDPSVDRSLCFLVQFDKQNPELHDGNGFGSIAGKKRSCWWCGAYELKKLSEAMTIGYLLNLRGK